MISYQQYKYRQYRALVGSADDANVRLEYERVQTVIQCHRHGIKTTLTGRD